MIFPPTHQHEQFDQCVIGIWRCAGAGDVRQRGTADALDKPSGEFPEDR